MEPGDTRVNRDRLVAKSRSSYPVALFPAILGLVAGLLITSIGLPGGDAYVATPEFQVWRVAIVAQVAVYSIVIAYFVFHPAEAAVPRAPAWTIAVAVAFILAAIVMPHFVPGTAAKLENLPLADQQYRIMTVLLVGLVAIGLLGARLTRIYAGFVQATTIANHVVLRKAAEDMLYLSALMVTLAALSTGILERSLRAVEASGSVNQGDVIAYGGYYTLVLFLFYLPVFLVERSTAVDLRKRLAGTHDPEIDSVLGLDIPLSGRVASMFGVVAPLLSVIAVRFTERLT